MRIVVDSDIWGVESLFGELGEVVSLPGRAIDSVAIRSADALVVRSVTRVDEKLLAGSCVRFIGTATSGTDHVDQDYLRRRGIVLAAAAGCNARPVVEYVVSCLFEWQRRTGRPLNQSALGVIGCGRIGRGVADWAEALGMRVLAVDPPLARAGQLGLCTLDQAIEEADIITLHMPFTKDGPDATQGLINARRLEQMKRGAWLINAARGRVVVDADLFAALDAKRLGGTIVDVWTDEPVVSQHLSRVTSLLTPHIAGYSAGAHRRAAQRIAAQLLNWVQGGEDSSLESSGAKPLGNHRAVERHSLATADMRIIGNLVQQACNIPNIDSEYRQLLKNVSPVIAFDASRAACRSRLELTDMELSGQSISSAADSLLRAWSESSDDRPTLG